MITPRLNELAGEIATILRDRGETIAVAEGSAGGLISATLLSVPGASAYFVGGTVVYTASAYRNFVAGTVPTPPGMRGATELFAAHLAEAVAAKLGTTWGLGEAGAAGPPNPYGDPAGHVWLAVHGPTPSTTSTRHVLTGIDDRPANMVAFATVALELLAEVLTTA